MPRSLTLPRVIMLLCLFSLSLKQATAQRLVGVDTLYGNEWLESVDDALKMMAVEEGIYRVTQADLLAAGWTNVSGSELGVVVMGKEIPITVTHASSWGNGDYLTFVASKDDFLTYEAEMYGTSEQRLFSPSRLTISDSLPYFLIRSGIIHDRFEIASNLPRTSTVATSLRAYQDPLQAQTNFIKRNTDNFNGAYSSFREGEGWCYAYSGSTSTLPISLPSLVPGPIELQLHTSSSWNRSIVREREISIDGMVISSTIIDPNSFLLDTFDITNTIQSSTDYTLTVRGVTSSADRQYVGYARTFYQAALIAVSGTQIFRETPLTGDRITSMQWDNLDPSLDYLLYDVTGHRILPFLGSSTQLLNLGSLNRGTKLILTASEDMHSPILEKLQFLSGIRTDDNYLIIESAKMASWNTKPSDYQAFRSSQVGGDFNCVRWSAEGIEDIFGYGIPRDARGIRNAIQYAKHASEVDQVLLIGKGREFHLVREPNQLDNPANETAFIPVYGTYGSDNLLALNRLTNKFTVGIGRIPVQSSADLQRMLNKAEAVANTTRAPKSLAEDRWTKQIIHLGGGSNASEQASLKAALLQMQATLAGSEFGPFFKSFYKDNDEPIQQADDEELQRLLDQGAAMMTFFGHSSGSAFDFNVADPERYNNNNRYPYIMSLGCFAGNMHVSGTTAGENFILSNDECAVAFGATVGLGYPFALSTFANDYYTAFGDLEYERSIGIALRYAINRSYEGGSPIREQLAEQYTLHGDPALMMYKAVGPDYMFDEASFNTANSELTAGVDSISLNIDLWNLGRSLPDSIYIILERETLSRSRETVDSILVTHLLGSSRTISTTIESWRDEGFGLNTVYYTVSSVGASIEAPLPNALNNNSTGALLFFIKDDGIDLLWPQDLAIIGRDSARIYASTRSPFNETIEFICELSTTSDFAAIAKSEVLYTSSLAEFDFADELEEGITYYWRIKTSRGDSTELSSVRSFTVSSSSGALLAWSPVVLDHYRSGQNRGLFPNEQGRWQIDTTSFSVRIISGADDVQRNQLIFNANIGGSKLFIGGRAPAIGLAIYEESTRSFIKYDDPRLPEGEPNFNEKVVLFRGNLAQKRAALLDALTNVAKPGDNVWVFAAYATNRLFQDSVYLKDSVAVGDLTLPALLSQNGARQAYNWASNSNRPYVFSFQKGGSVLGEQLASSLEGVVDIETFAKVLSTSGSYRTPTFPRAQAYESLRYTTRVDSLTYAGEVSLIGITNAGQEVELDRSRASVGSFDLTMIDPQAYSSLLLELAINGADSLSTPRFANVELIYTPLPELSYEQTSAVEPKDTVRQGETLLVKFKVRNVSVTPIIFATASLDFLSNINSTSPLSATIDTLGAIDAWASATAILPRETRSVKNAQNFFTRLSAGGQQQTSRNNDLGSRKFYVIADEIAPIVQLFVNGELPKPGIMLVTNPVFEIKVLDDDIFADMSVDELQLSLKQADGILLEGPNLPGQVSRMNRDQTATLTKTSFLYDPGKIEDGEYELRVRARDLSGNQNPVLTSLRFEVNSRTAASNLLPYPNPFIDLVRFQYEVTGTPPEDYRLSIYSISGRLVRELGPIDLGSLRVGKQLTDRGWDGSDQFGQALAKGVYLYRIEYAYPSGETLDTEHRETQIDRWIKGGFGKLVKL